MSSKLLLIMLTTLLLTVSMSNGLIYDYLVLSLQWPPALCRAAPIGCRKFPAPRFGIHGLWPSSYQGSDPVDCGNMFGGLMFDPNVCYDPAIKTNLNNVWPNYLGKNIKFWQIEWDKHGTCAYEVLDQRNYFLHAIGMYGAVSIDSLLTMGLNILPDFNLDHDLTMFKQAIASKLGNARPTVMCGGGVNGMPLEIQEIRICYNAFGNQFINCTKGDSSCGSGTKVKWYI